MAEKNKTLATMSKDDLYYCLLNNIPTGWDVFNFHIDKHW